MFYYENIKCDVSTYSPNKIQLNNLENKKEAKTFDLESLLSPFLLNHYDLL